MHIPKARYGDNQGEVDPAPSAGVAVRSGATAGPPTDPAQRLGEGMARALLEAGNAVMYAVDRDGRFVLANRAFAELLERPVSEIVGRQVDEIFPAEIAGQLRECVATVVGSGSEGVLEQELEVGDQPRLLHTVQLPLRDAAGRITAMGAVATDISWCREAEQTLTAREELAQALVAELELTNHELRTADMFKDELLAVTSHELRTPLAAVVGYTSLLMRHGSRIDADKQAEYLATVLAEAQRLSRLVEDLLTLSRLRAGAERVVRRPVDVRHLLDRLTVVVPMVDLRLDVEKDVSLVADAGRLEQVLTNLVENAKRYGREPVEVSVRRDSDDIVLRVRDHGDGVPQEFVPELFNAFARGPGQATRSRGGSGLGLAVVQGLVRAHSGEVAYSQAEGGGALFTVRLPVTP